ncbi:Glycosyltransferase Family 4 [Sporolituus thermophilus DSM 23256]|uniref:Glycosyltransferase Family 4 n=1 Tax=Sporolituus thermophilus DSM 23256 TaxID=1123285 RepID=A0A1G7IP75_9FIRM|nr:Glycosyltransferase Family 4 [Sporolituus thermophilus DSM 23256]
MRVVHVNLFDFQGGAARIAWTLMDGMTSLGYDVHLFAHRCTTNDPRVIPTPFTEAKWQQKLLRQQSQEGLFDLYSAALIKVLNDPLFDQADIVHLHCIDGGYFSFLLLPFLTAKPTVWTMHDPLAFTAGCLNSGSCDSWRHNWCAQCPQDENIKKPPQRELVQLIKASVYKIAKFTVVCPSAWLEKQAKDSILQGHDIRLIYNGIDTDNFRPGDRAKLRKKLGLPADKKIIMFAAHGGFDKNAKDGVVLAQTLKKLHDRYPELLLLNIGTIDNSAFTGLPTPRIDLPFIADPRLLAEYYGAADLFVSTSLVDLSLTICEAMACGTPVVAFAVGGTPEIVVHAETGYLAVPGDSDDLVRGITYFLDDGAVRQRAGDAARLRIIDKFSAKRMVDDYIDLYEEILWAAGGPNLIAVGPERLPRLIAKSQSQGWAQVWQEFRKLYNTFAPEDVPQRAIFLDRFFSCCLQSVNAAAQSSEFWDIIEQWHKYRLLPLRCDGLPPAEQQALLYFCQILREKMREYLVHTPLTELAKLNEQRQQLLLKIWRQVFLDAFSSLNLEANVPAAPGHSQDFPVDRSSADWYKQLMVASMDYPFAAPTSPITAVELWQHPVLPFCVKAIITYWLLNVPFFNIAEQHRQKFLQYASELCQLSMSRRFFIPFVGAVMEGFWRISYVGGNNVDALSAFGDFIARHMRRFFPQYAALDHSRKKRRTGDKIRIGYISRMFRHQAVSYYMVNRVIHHDKSKFEVYVFALGGYHDEISELFVKHSDYFKRFPNMYDIESIAQSIVDSQLDILIYTDIGMDPVTYMLAGLQLAPVQCAMVGHGTTTGMPTIQYYISGDFEPVDADRHYRETLIRLPNLGAAQYPPPFTQEPLPTRKDWKIPEDVVVFVSCANGIKHGPQRDALLIDILKKAPNACIVLKPYHASNVDNPLTRRIMTIAREAGVDNRLFIIPPLKHVVALLAIADVQLDTYPYGGWTTNMEALYMGLPIVTQEGEMARSRWGAHMLRALGIQEGIAVNETQYVDWAVRFAQDEELRRRVRDQIRKRARSILFNGAAAQPAFEAVLTRLVNEYRAAKHQAGFYAVRRKW